ncbi:MAG: hypothetical protein HXY22_08790 [Alphaproteobacteria bacterium]|nr:hypothetical protein [Alphaproteobacteria bacterium]
MRIVSMLVGLLILGGGFAYIVALRQSDKMSFADVMGTIGVSVPGEEVLEKEYAAADVTTGEGEGEIRRIVIGLDLSASNPLVSNPEYAAKAAERVAGMITPLGFRSEVVMRTFGAYGGGGNSFRFDATISSRYRPEDMAAEVKTLIASTPALIKRGVWQTQQQTNILGWLENMSQVVDCKGMKTTYVLLTDGLEDSEYVRLKNKNATLPVPNPALFRGCDELIFLGLGRGTQSPETTGRLREEWHLWADKAGFRSYVGLNDW